MTDAVLAVPSVFLEKRASTWDNAATEHELRAFRDWLKQQPHMPHDIPDETLTHYLNAQDHSLEMAKITLDRAYSIRTAAPEIFSDRNPFAPEIQHVFKIGYFGSLPRRCPDGLVPFIAAIRDPDPNKFNFVAAVKAALMVLDLVQIRDGPVPGYRLILDMRGSTIAHVGKINFATMKRGLDYEQEGLPVKLKGVHIINAIPLVHQVLALVKPMLKPETRALLNVHTEAQVKKFYEFVPKELMPKDYGGESPSIADLTDATRRGVEQLEPFFREEQRQRVKEALRPARSKGGYKSAFIGSFKKLDLD